MRAGLPKHIQAQYTQPFGWTQGADAAQAQENTSNAAAQAKAQEAMDKATAAGGGSQMP